MIYAILIWIMRRFDEGNLGERRENKMNYELSLGTFEPMTLTEEHDTNGGGFIAMVVGGCLTLVGAAIYDGVDNLVERNTGKSIGEHIGDFCSWLWDLVF